MVMRIKSFEHKNKLVINEKQQFHEYSHLTIQPLSKVELERRNSMDDEG
jgi:hypothetical protein